MGFGAGSEEKSGVPLMKAVFPFRFLVNLQPDD